MGVFILVIFLFSVLFMVLCPCERLILFAFKNLFLRFVMAVGEERGKGIMTCCSK